MPATVLQLSDTHLTAEPGGRVHGVDGDERLHAVLDAWRASGEQANLVLLTGDIADDGSLAACARVAEAVGALGAPVLALPGNHDLPETVDLAFAGGDAADVGSWQVLALDTTVRGEGHGEVDAAAALARLDELGAQPTLLALHHPPLSPSEHRYFQLRGAAPLLAGLRDRPHVRAVVAGHLHEAFERSLPGGAAVLGCPSTLVAIRHEGSDMQLGIEGATGARVVELHDDGTVASHLLLA